MCLRALSIGIIRVFLTLAVLLITSAWAQNARQFNFWGNNGSTPSGGLAVDAVGNFYGVTYIGGPSNLGVVYELSPSSDGAAETVLYSFSGTETGDGANPIGDLLFDRAGNLYGATQFGGNAGVSCDPRGCGTVFELSPPSQPGGPWSESVLYRFQGSPSDGDQPLAGLIFDGAGNLFGTTSVGGIQSAQCGCGTVFELSPPSEPGRAWLETVLYMFQGSPDGSQPTAGVIFDSVGNLYGTTSADGLYRAGAVFQLTPPSFPGGAWTEKLIHSLLSIKDGSIPVAGLTLNGNTLFGTASQGGFYGEGTLFRLLPLPNPGGDWTYEVVHNFSGSDGADPLAPLTFTGPSKGYGTTGGGKLGATLFEISGSGNNVTYTLLYIFPAGSEPTTRLTVYGHALYVGTEGGGYKGNGSVYQLGR